MAFAVISLPAKKGGDCFQMQLSDFHILDEIYRGPAGAIFKARRKSDKMLCALKERRYAEVRCS